MAHHDDAHDAYDAREPTPYDPTAEPQYLPVESPVFLKKFLHQYYDTLCREAARACYQYNIPDYAGDALSISFEKFMTSRIEDRGPRSAISFAVRILKNTCIDEARRRGRHAIPAGALISNDDDDGGDFIQERVAEQTTSGDPEAQLIATAEMNAVDLGFELLPTLTRKTHKNVERDLDIVRKRYVLRMSWGEIAQGMGEGKAHRQSAARGRELLRGWVHALCGTQPEPDAANRKYWQRGYECGCAYREQLSTPSSPNPTTAAG
jgi:RNA polymerase sigma factor (sigma-70 family)